MISEKIVRKRISESIFDNYQMNYLTKFDLNVDIVYMFCAKVLFFFFERLIRRE